MEAYEVIAEAMKAFAPPPDITGSEWADTYRTLSSGPMPGRWDTDNTPDLRYPLDCITDPEVTTVVIVKPTRTGGTEVINTAIGYFQHYEPCSVLYAQSTKDQGELYSDTIFMPMVYSTPVLNELLIRELGRNATQTKTKKTFKGGGSLRIIGAKSPRGFQALEARVAIADDFDEWEDHKNGDPGKKLVDRTKGIYNRKLFFVSYPNSSNATSRIMTYYNRTNQLHWYVPCPLCDEYQELKFGGRDIKYGLKWNDEGVIWYECEHCHGKIPESQKHAMSLKGEWRPHGETKTEGWIGIKLNPFVRKWHDWAHIRDEFLECGSDPSKLMVFFNQTLGEEWKPYSSGTSYKKLRNQCIDYSAEAPHGVLFITIGGDVQADRIEAEATGYGRGYEEWSIEKKVFYGDTSQEAVWNDLRQFLQKTWQHESGIQMGSSRSFIDSGDGNISQTVYDFTTPLEATGVFSIKGSSTRWQAIFARWSTVSDKKTKLALIGTDTAKSLLYSWMSLEEHGQGYMHFPMSYHEDVEYFKQLTSEYLDGKNTWQVKQGRRNERLDCKVYSLAAAYSLNPDWDELERNIGVDGSAYRVITDYDALKHQNQKIEEDMVRPIIVCVDFDSDVWLLAQSDGRNIEVFDEIILRGADVARMGKEIRKRHPDRFKSGGGFIIYGPKDEKSSYALLSELDLRTQRPNRKSDLKGGINAINNMLEGLNGEVRLTFHPRCVMLRKDFEMAQWKEDGSDIDRASGRGSAITALAHYIGTAFPIRRAKVNPSRRFYK